jgi:purine-nucleoside phosphorylase
VIMAGKLGMRCAAVSVLTDECDPDNLVPVTLEEIIRVASAADKVLSELFEEIIHQC